MGDSCEQDKPAGIIDQEGTVRAGQMAQGIEVLAIRVYPLSLIRGPTW